MQGYQAGRSPQGLNQNSASYCICQLTEKLQGMFLRDVLVVKPLDKVRVTGYTPPWANSSDSTKYCMRRGGPLLHIQEPLEC